MSELITPFLVASAVQAITPILLAALAGVISGRAGVFNMALEGQMLIGAFAAIVGSFVFGSAAAGVVAAVAAVVVFSLILAYGATVFRGDPVVICIGMNLLASGLTAYLLRQTFGVSGTFSDPAVVGLAKIRIAAIAGIPVFGWGFGRQTVVTWLAWGLVAADQRRHVPDAGRPAAPRRRRAGGRRRDARHQCPRATGSPPCSSPARSAASPGRSSRSARSPSSPRT